MQFSKWFFYFVLLFPTLNMARAQSKTVPAPARDTVTIKVDSLKAAVVTAVLRPKVKGDTIEYNSSSIQLPPHAKVEQLLQRLPGLRIEPDGSISFNGEKIEHLLVDGEDIFGSDPTIVTKNFDASKIAKVQVLDRKSDRALFTGVDDGVRAKTLNLVMKEDAKNGFFGQSGFGRNLEGQYGAGAVLAVFKDKQQLTIVAFSSNTGVTGFSNSPGEAGVNLISKSADPLDASAGLGIPEFDATAVHFNRGQNDGQDHLTVNYQMSHYFSKPLTSTLVYEILPDSVYSRNSRSGSVNQAHQQWLYGILDWAIDARSAFKLAFYGTSSDGSNRLASVDSSRFNDTVINANSEQIQDKVGDNSFGCDLSWRTNVGKSSKRIVSVNMGFDREVVSTVGFVYSLGTFYFPNYQIQSFDTVDQRKVISTKITGLKGGASFSQSIFGNGSFGIGWTLEGSGNNPSQKSYNKVGGKYLDLVDSLSSNYRTEHIKNIFLFSFQGHFGHLNYSINDSWVSYRYRQNDLLSGMSSNFNYFALMPQAVLDYKFSGNAIISASYNSYELLPTVGQLVPVVNNTDPLHVSIGNANLKPTLNRDVEFNFNSFKKWSVNMKAYLGFQSNSISARTLTDSLGRQISQPVNVEGGKNWAFNFSFDRHIRGIDLGLHGVDSYDENIDFVNNDLSRNHSFSINAGLSIRTFKAEHYSFALNSDFTYFEQKSSLAGSSPVHYCQLSDQGMLVVYVFKPFELGSTGNFTWQGKSIALGPATSVFLLAAYGARNFIQDRLSIRLQINNIFNKEASITRSNQGNTSTDVMTNIMGRYWMLSATWHFDKKFKKK
jgi:hypothetical protein